MSPKRLITSRLTGAGSLLPPVYSEAWDKGNAKVSPGHHFPPYGTPHTANVRVEVIEWSYLCSTCEALTLDLRSGLLNILLAGNLLQAGAFQQTRTSDPSSIVFFFRFCSLPPRIESIRFSQDASKRKEEKGERSKKFY
ncbi:hypothetical protein TNCV_3390831 [Trichonephila clavipes]|nr:hypothetical protein TNCV_3390831 [Trichonephila clavipes]